MSAEKCSVNESSRAPGSPREVVKITANLPVLVFDALKDLAQKRGTTMTETVRQAVSTEHFFMHRLEEGESIVIMDQNKTAIREVIFKD